MSTESHDRCLIEARRAQRKYSEALPYRGVARGLRRASQFFQVGADGLVGGRVGQHFRIGLDAPVAAGFAVKVRPPVAVLSQPLLPPVFPVHEHARPAFVTVTDGVLRVLEVLEIPVAADAGVEHFVGPVIILEQGGQPIPGKCSWQSW